MFRLRASLTAAALLAAGALGAGPATAHEDHIHELPAPGCYTVADPAGDAHVGSIPEGPNDPDLDMLGLVLRTTPSSLQAYIRVSDLGAGPTIGDGHRFFVDFTFNGHVFSMAASHYKVGTGAIRDGLASTGEFGKTVQLSVDGRRQLMMTEDAGYKASGLKATFDPTANFVLLELPFADIGKYGGRTFTGEITDVRAHAGIDNYLGGMIADVSGSEEIVGKPARWAIADNRCFAVATKLSLSVTKYPAQRTVTAKLATASGQSLGGRALTYYVNGKRYASVRTASNGTASVRNIKPGSTVTVEFVAATSYLGSTAQKKV